MCDSDTEALSAEADAARSSSEIPSAPATLFVCDTCRYEPQVREHEGRTGGEIFAELIERLLQHQGIRGITVQRISCLMACTRHCTAHLRSPGKFGYVIGDFRPDASSAQVLLDYAMKYRLSETGQVPYKTWPEGIKGHFIARTPP